MYSQVMKWREETGIQLRDVLLGNVSRDVALNNNMEERIECHGAEGHIKTNSPLLYSQTAARDKDFHGERGLFVCLFSEL